VGGALEVAGADVVGCWLRGALVAGAVVVGWSAVGRGALVVVRGALVVLRGAVAEVVGVLVDVAGGAWSVVVDGAVGAVVVGRASLGSAEFGTGTVRPLGRTTSVVPPFACGSPAFSA
jgi:hypothetical protein